MKYTIILLLLIALESIGQDYSNSGLTPVYGQKYFTGITDCKASVEVYSRKTGIEFIVEVKDDQIKTTDKLIRSDHVEFWFSMDRKPRNYVNYNGIFYESREDEAGVGSKEGFIEFLNSKEGSYGEPDQGEEESVSVSSKDIKIKPEFTGMIHWGIDIKTSKIILFDTTEYASHAPTQRLDKHISVKKNPFEGGYSYSVLLNPLAFGYSADSVLSSLIFMVDVFDTDADKDLTVLSTSSKREWGNPKTFNETKLTQSYAIDLTPNKYFKEGFYAVVDDKWKRVYKSEQSTSYFQPYYPFVFKPLEEINDVDTLKDGSLVVMEGIIVEYIEGAPTTNLYYKFKNFNFEASFNGCGEKEGMEVKVIGPDQYAVTTSSCYMGNPWGIGACGSCDFITDIYYLIKNKQLNKVVEIGYGSSGRIRIGDKEFSGDFQKSDWINNYQGFELNYSSYEGDKQECYSEIIKWDKNFQQKSSVLPVACP